MPTPPPSATPLLPALSVALGLPLCRGGCRTGAADGAGVGDPTPSTTAASSSSSGRTGAPSSRRREREEALAERARNNASRIYARRVVNRARLEREHPWARAASASTSSTSSVDSSLRGGSGGIYNGGQPWSGGKMSEPSVAAATATAAAAAVDEKLQKWKDELLSETLVSLIKLQERARRVKSFASFNLEGRHGDPFAVDGNDLLRQLGVFPANSNVNVARCESITAKQRTLNDYEVLSENAVNDKLKPAEWSDDVDLVQRRLEFGREISPLSDTTRLQRWAMAFRRAVALGTLAAPLGAMVPLNALLGKFAGTPAPSSGDGTAETTTALQRWHRGLVRASWDYALWAVEAAGPTYIKLVQWASTRNDLFSPEFVGHFSKLQDETRGHSWGETEATLVRALGKDWRDLLSFDEVIDDEDDETDGAEGGRLKRKGGAANRERQRRLRARETKRKNASSSSSPTVPIGSGCVAQVYKARLRSSHGLHPAGTSVAVKVQHPRILEKVCLDFYIFNKVASLLERVPYLNLDYLSMKDSVDQFRDIMLPQLDLRVEAHNLRRFRRDFEGEAQIAFPEPLAGLTSREVLVERFVEGEPMLNFVTREDDEHSRDDREELARIGLKTVMEMIFLHDFVHADLHPGNMIVDRNKSVRGRPLRVHMIDCGLTVELGERDHMNLVRILGSLIKRDGHAAGRLMVDTAKKCQATELDVELFCRGIEKICVDDEDQNFLESVGDYITDICYLACKHKVKLEAAFINAALACEIMEGLASSLYPEMEVQSVALPMVLKAEMMHGLKGKFGYF